MSYYSKHCGWGGILLVLTLVFGYSEQNHTLIIVCCEKFLSSQLQTYQYSYAEDRNINIDKGTLIYIYIRHFVHVQQ